MADFAPLAGIDVVVSESLAGQKRAVRIGNRVFVSPAMSALIDSDPQALLASLDVVDLGTSADPFNPIWRPSIFNP